MKNIDITKKILFNNIKGSFLLVLRRQVDPNEPVDFISDMRVAVYHHVIVDEGKKISYPDMMDEFNYEPYETHFNNLDDKYDDAEFYITDSDIKLLHNIKKEDDIPDKISMDIVNICTDILTNKSKALVYIKDNLYGRIAGYKVYCMKGLSISTYFADVFGNDIKEFKCIHGEDILGNNILVEGFKTFFRRAL